MVRKILAGVLIGLSGLLFVLSLAVMVASWVYNEPLTENITGRLVEIDSELAAAQTALQDARAELERTLRLVEAAEETLSALKEELAQSKTFVGDVDNVLETQLIPGLKASRGQVAQARGALEEVRKAIEDFNAIPFIEFDLPGDEMLAGLIDAADSIDDQIGQVQTLAEQASTFARDASYLMGGDLGETRQSLENFLALVTEYDEKVVVWREQVAVLKASLPGWIDTATVVSSLFLFWFAFSQAGMFLHGLTLWKNGDPLAALRTPVS